MIVTFLFSGLSFKIAGGYKVVYEYANRLSNDGCKVNIVYSLKCYNKKHWKVLLGTLFRIIRVGLYGYKAKWFHLDYGISEHLVWNLNRNNVPKSDLYIATSVETAYVLNNYDINTNNGYFIQGFESWNGITTDEVIQSYHFPLRKVVIAEWLESIVHACGEQCTVIPNGFDFNYFIKKVDFADKNKYQITMLYHPAKRKGCQDAFTALNIVKARFPKLTVHLFGTYPKPKSLPNWFYYYKCPNKEVHNHLYNESAIFIGASHTEGWGLTIGEAMMCGAAVVCTDNAGYQEMAKNGVTALVSKIQDSKALADNIIYLIENDNLRIEIAQNGYKFIQQFTWENSYNKFKSALSL